MRHRLLLAALLLGVSTPLSARSTAAAPPLAVTGTPTHEYRFAQEIIFRLDATSDVPIESATLRWRADQLDFKPEPADITPGTAIHAEVSKELRGGVLPPFSTVTYWWEVRDASGALSEIGPVDFAYIDNRYAWQRLSREGVTILWSDGDSAFAQRVLDTALAALPRISAEIGVARPDTIDVYVYPSQEDLIGALQLGGRDWAGGQARPELGVVLVDLPPDETAPVEMQRVIPHELTHLVVYAATQPEYDRVPAWLDEGLATANESSPDTSQTLAVANAAQSDRLLSLDRLCAAFPEDAGQALLAYAQSGSLVQFVRNRYGRQGIQNLLAAYREKAECAAGVERALNVTLPALESQWRAQFATGSQAVNAAAETGAPWLVLLAVMALAMLPMLGGLSAARRDQRQEQE